MGALAPFLGLFASIAVVHATYHAHVVANGSFEPPYLLMLLAQIFVVGICDASVPFGTSDRV